MENKSNWIDTFTSIVDLKQLIGAKFKRFASPKRLLDAIGSNSFSVFQTTFDFNEVGPSGGGSINGELVVHFTNISNSPAFNVSMYWSADDDIDQNEADDGDSIVEPILASKATTGIRKSAIQGEWGQKDFRWCCVAKV